MLDCHDKATKSTAPVNHTRGVEFGGSACVLRLCTKLTLIES